MIQRAKKNQPENSSTDAERFWSVAERLRGHITLPEYRQFILKLLYLRSTDIASPSQKNGHNAWRKVLSAMESPQLFGVLANSMTLVSEQLKLPTPNESYPVALDQTALHELVLFANRLHDRKVLIDSFEYCLQQFAQREGRGSGEFFTASSLVDLLVNTLAPSGGNVFDPCCGAGGFLANAQQYGHYNATAKMKFFGQESNADVWQLCQYNLNIREINCDLGPGPADSFRADQHNGLRADFIFANPPFNTDHWCVGEAVNQSWTFGTPPSSNANYAWIQHIIRHMSSCGMAAFTMGNAALTSTFCGEDDIRRRIVEADYIDCIIGLPPFLFHTTRIPASVWILAADKTDGIIHGQNVRMHRRKTLFIDAQKLGRLIDRVHRTLDTEDIERIAGTYRAWRGSSKSKYEDIPGFCRSCGTEDIAANNYLLTPARFVGAQLQQSAEDNPEARLEELTRALDQQFKESARLEQQIRQGLARLGYEI